LKQFLMHDQSTKKVKTAVILTRAGDLDNHAETSKISKISK